MPCFHQDCACLTLFTEAIVLGCPQFQHVPYLFIMPSSETDIVIGRPSGRYAVGCGTANLTDTTRIDPLDPKQGPRRVMVSLFYPIERSGVSTTTVIPYATPLATKVLDIGLERVGFPKLTALLRMQLGTGVVRDIESIPLGAWWRADRWAQLQCRNIIEVISIR